MAGATGVVTVSFWALLIGLAAGTEGSPLGAAWALALALIPFAFMVAAFGSLHDRAAGAVVWAMVLAVGVGGSLLAVRIDPATALIGAYAVGAVVTVRETPRTSMKRRTLFALGVTVVAGVLLNFLLVVGAAIAPALPFAAAAWADHTNPE